MGYVRWIKRRFRPAPNQLTPAPVKTSKDWLCQPNIDSPALCLHQKSASNPVKSTLGNGSAPSFPSPLDDPFPKSVDGFGDPRRSRCPLLPSGAEMAREGKQGSWVGLGSLPAHNFLFLWSWGREFPGFTPLKGWGLFKGTGSSLG